MSESVKIDRQQGDPLEFTVDLKWSLWSRDAGYWQDMAPNTYDHLKAGFDVAFDEYGDTIWIHTAPRKEIRFGRVGIDPKEGRCAVTFWAEFDDIPSVYALTSFHLPDTLDEFLRMVDDVEASLIERIAAATSD